METKTDSLADQLPQELDALWRFALRLCHHREEAKDLVQQTCLRALEQQDRYLNTGRLRSWLFRILHNLWVNRVLSLDYRAQQMVGERPGEWDVVELDRYRSSQDAGEAMDTTLLLGQVFEAVQQLPDKQRHIIELVCVEGFSYREAAEILDVKIGTVMSRLARARLKIGRTVSLNETTEPGSTPGREHDA